MGIEAGAQRISPRPRNSFGTHGQPERRMAAMGRSAAVREIVGGKWAWNYSLCEKYVAKVPPQTIVRGQERCGGTDRDIPAGGSADRSASPRRRGPARASGARGAAGLARFAFGGSLEGPGNHGPSSARARRSRATIRRAPRRSQESAGGNGITG